VLSIKKAPSSFQEEEENARGGATNSCRRGKTIGEGRIRQRGEELEEGFWRRMHPKKPRGDKRDNDCDGRRQKDFEVAGAPKRTGKEESIQVAKQVKKV